MLGCVVLFYDSCGGFSDMDRHKDLFAAALNAIETLGDKNSGTSTPESAVPETAMKPEGQSEASAPASTTAPTRPVMQAVSQSTPAQPAPAAEAPAEPAHKGLFGSKFGFSHSNPKDPMSILGSLLAGGRKKGADKPEPEPVKPVKPLRPAQVVDISMPADWDGTAKKPAPEAQEVSAGQKLMAEAKKSQNLGNGPMRMSDIMSHLTKETETDTDNVADAAIAASAAGQVPAENTVAAGVDAPSVPVDDNEPSGFDIDMSEPEPDAPAEPARPVAVAEPARPAEPVRQAAPVRPAAFSAARTADKPVNETATPVAAPVAVEKPEADAGLQVNVSGDAAQQIAALQAEYRAKYKSKLLEMKAFYETQVNDVCAQHDEMKAHLEAMRASFEQIKQENAAVKQENAMLWQENAAVKQENAAVKQENTQLRVHSVALSDKLGRSSSEFDNYRKRVARDQEQYKNQTEERIISGFLPVMDNLDRALLHARKSRDYDQLLEGVEMTGRLYLAALAKFGCVPFDSMGKECDPNYHDVLERVIDSDVPHNTVVQEHLRGYLMHDRVLRPALVAVAQHEGSEDGGE